MKLLTAIVVSLALIACADKSKPGDAPSGNGNGSSGSAQEPVVEELTYTSYAFNSTDALGEACTTGRHTFHAHAEMCLQIQNPERNNDCAWAERRAAFDKVCRDTGFRFEESLSCTFVLYEWGGGGCGLEDAKILASKTVCAGRTPNPYAVTEPTSIAHSILSDALFTADLNYVPLRNENAFNFALIQLRLIDSKEDPSSPTRDYFTPYLFTRGKNTTACGSLRGHPGISYFYQCGNTWACTGAATN